MASLLDKVREFFRGETVTVPDSDPVGEVLSQLYDDILAHRVELDRSDRPEYQAEVAAGLMTLNQIVPDEVSKRWALVLLAESLKD